MSDIVIKSENLGKKYVIGHKAEDGRYVALRDVLAQSARNIWHTTKDLMQGNPIVIGDVTEEIWALKDVNFEIRRGEVVGIIGRNGAGKSTLLKVLSRITEPSAGRVTIKGRVASLLEVGTGFHPELTGRENIYVNGAILGMTRADVKRKFDEIVDFSGVERFVDTPVKRFSSGMQVRLAFAVAAHLDPEILLIDEVLAVGDAEFQRKCLGKMEIIAGEGRTVLFVSHNMDSIEKLCRRAIWIHDGTSVMDSRSVTDVIQRYLAGDSNSRSGIWENSGDEFENQWCKPLRFYIADEAGNPQPMPVRNDADIRLVLDCEIREAEPSLIIGYGLYSENRTLLYNSWTHDQPETSWPSFLPGICTLSTIIPRRLLNEGRYTVELLAQVRYAAASKIQIVHPEHNPIAVQLEVQGGLRDSPITAKRPGLLAPVLPWAVQDRHSV